MSDLLHHFTSPCSHEKSKNDDTKSTLENEKNIKTNSLDKTAMDLSGRYPYEPLAINNIQLYNPIYTKFFVMTNNNYNHILLNHKYHIFDTHTIYDFETNTCSSRDIFIKYSPLLDPFSYMIGKYDSYKEKVTVLPKLNIDTDSCIPKTMNPNNASYIDNFFCYLSSQILNHHSVIHGIDYYGSFLGIQDAYCIDIEEDFDYLTESEFFLENKNKLFFIDHSHDMDSMYDLGSRHNRKCIVIDKDEHSVVSHTLSEISILSIHEDDYTNPSSTFDIMDISDSIHVDDSSMKLLNNTSLSTNNSDLNYSSDEDNDHSDNGCDIDDDNSNSDSDHSSNYTTESDEDIDDESIPMYAYIKNFPIQLICLEKCKGTLDGLFMKKQVNEKNAAAILFQIIMTLLIYQRMFAFTHNDLHTNNIMYINTEHEYIYYIYKGLYYRVPTYGYIFKIIDFGRAIYRFQGNIFCSDSFGPAGDAHTQYNTEPYLDESKPRLEPNYSFDLCRLGCSIYDFIIDEYDDKETTVMNQLQKLIAEWCRDDNGKNVLYKKTGEERYPNFKLYKMIARTVHQHTPENQLKNPYFSQFVYKKSAKSMTADVAPLIHIDQLPSYIS
jgi:hypothetical protein